MAKRVKVLVSKVTDEDFYRRYLRIINGLLKVPLTKSELEVLVAIHKQSNGFDALTAELRRRVRESLGYTRLNLNNFISLLKQKGALEFDTDHGLIVIAKGFECPRMEKGDKLILGLMFDIQWQ